MPTFSSNQGGLNPVKWAKWRRDLLTTGTYDPNRWEELSRQQKWWTKETLNILKNLSNN